MSALYWTIIAFKDEESDERIINQARTRAISSIDRHEWLRISHGIPIEPHKISSMAGSYF